MIYIFNFYLSKNLYVLLKYYNDQILLILIFFNLKI